MVGRATLELCDSVKPPLRVLFAHAVRRTPRALCGCPVLALRVRGSRMSAIQGCMLRLAECAVGIAHNRKPDWGRRCAVSGVLSALMSVVLIFGADASTRDAARLEGAWRFDSIEVDGAKRPAPPFETSKVLILKDGRFVIVQGNTFTHGTMQLDATKSPKQYDSTLTTGPAKGMTFKCIYSLEGDTYKLCGPYAGGDRPSEFVTKPGGGLVMQVLKREKQSVHDAVTEAARREMAGTWQGTSCVRDGKPEADESVSAMKLVLDIDGKATGSGMQGISLTATTKIDAVADPLTIDLQYTDGKMKGRTSLGIATIDGETMTICRAAPGKPRPTEFSSDTGSGRTLVTYRRAASEGK
jgi:uncharacterized protein (TIGR03067 family)